MKFADFYPGQILRHGPASLSAEAIVSFAKQWDPQWFHVEPERAAEGPYKGLIASGWQSCALMMRMACEVALDGSESIGSPGLAYVKWLQPVRPDTPLYLQIEVLEVRRSEKRPTLGVVRWGWQLQLENGTAALATEATSLFELSPP